MKKMCVLILTLTLCLTATATAEEYPLTTRVYAVDPDADIVTVETFNGMLYSFDGVEDWIKGDCCSVIMDDNGTSEVFDDKIVSVRYCAWELINWKMDED